LKIGANVEVVFKSYVDSDTW